MVREFCPKRLIYEGLADGNPNVPPHCSMIWHALLNAEADRTITKPTQSRRAVFTRTSTLLLRRNCRHRRSRSCHFIGDTGEHETTSIACGSKELASISKDACRNCSGSKNVPTSTSGAFTGGAAGSHCVLF